MRVALIHDFLTQLGGAERVLDSLLEMFPKAPVFTLLHDAGATENRYQKFDIRPSFLQKFPKNWSYKWYLPLMPRAVESFNLSDFDLAISDASAFSKGVNLPAGVPHICYCHTPTRYLWTESENYINSLPYSGLVKWCARQWLSRLKKWDYTKAQKVTLFLANSKEVQARIEKHYHRDSQVVYPPVDTDFFYPAEFPTRDYFLIAGRLEPYKRADVVLKAFEKLRLPLLVAGSGSMAEKLKRAHQKANIRFLGRVSDEKLRELYQNAKAFIFPAKEDAGMMIIESLACGTPVIAYKAGGALEFIEEGNTGIFFKEQNSESLSAVLKSFTGSNFLGRHLRETAEKFNKNLFKKAFSSIINNQLYR